jgi:hypothetical protein
MKILDIFRNRRNGRNDFLKCSNPLCWLDIPFGDMEYRCMDGHSQRGRDFEDTIIPQQILRKKRCPHKPDDREMRCGRRLIPYCPQCGEHWRPMGKANLLGLIGTSFAGKSIYISTLYDTLRQPYGDWYNWGVEIADGELKRQFYSEIYEPYSRNIPPIRSDPGQGIHVPIRLQPNNISYLKSQTEVIFCDKSGDMDTDLDRMIETMPYLSEVKGLLFLVDPYSIPQLREATSFRKTTLPKEEWIMGREAVPNRDDPNLNADMVLLNATNAMRNWFPDVDKPIPIRLAVIIAKSDLIWEFCPEPLEDEALELLQRTNRHENGPNKALLKEVDGVVRNFLMSDQVGMANLVRNTSPFADVRFFMVSCLDARGQIGGDKIERDPKAVEDPVFWLIFD